MSTTCLRMCVCRYMYTKMWSLRWVGITFLKTSKNIGVATIHLPTIHFENVIPALGGNHIFWNKQKQRRRNNSTPENSFWKRDPHAGWESHFSKQSKKVKHTWTAQMPNVVKSFWNFQETCFSSIIAAEVLKKTKLALPRSTGIKQNNASHRAWGSHSWFLQHP